MNLSSLVWNTNLILFLIALTLVFSAAVSSSYDFLNAIKRLNRRRRLKLLLKKAFSGENKTLSDLSEADCLLIGQNPYEFSDDETTLKLKNIFRDSDKQNRLHNILRNTKKKWKKIDALLFLAFVGDITILSVLKKRLGSRDEDVRYFAMIALARLATDEATALLLESLGKASYSGHKVAALLQRAPGLRSETLLTFLESAQEQTRYWTLKLLIHLQKPASTEAVINKTQDASAEVRAAACEVLNAWGEENAAEPLKKLLKDPMWFVRMRAVRALGKILGDRAVEIMTPIMFEDANLYVKESAKNICIRHIEKLVPHLTECLIHSSSEATKRFCISCLVETGQIIPILLRVTDKASPGYEKAKTLFTGMVQSGIYFGLKPAMDELTPAKRQAVLNEVTGADPALAERLRHEFEKELT